MTEWNDIMTAVSTALSGDGAMIRSGLERLRERYKSAAAS